jgi:hypothetical protein
VNDPESLHVFEATHQLDGKSPDESLLETGVIVHLDKFIQVQTE